MLESLEGIRLLADLVIILFSALGFGYIASKLKQPVILGYLVAGIIIGPFLLGFINKIEEVHVLAQMGVAFLLFVVGLEFSPTTLKKIWKVSVVGGILEMTFMFMIGFGIGTVFGLGFIQSVFIGAMIAISSTIVVIRVLQNLGEEKELAGRMMVGLLIVQDIGVIVIVTILSNLFLVDGGGDPSAYIFPIVYSLIFVSLVLTLGKFLLPKIIKMVSHVDNKNLFLLTILVISLGTATVAYMLDIPLALGAFLAGLVLAESEYGTEIVNKIRPLRDVFMIIFFVSIGMSVNIFLVGQNILFLLVFISSMIVGKFTIFSFASKVFGYTTKTAFKVGLGLIQIGEFSFVMAELGYFNDLISPTVYSSVITAGLITIMLTPYSIKKSDSIYSWFRQFGSLSRVINKIFPRGQEKAEVDAVRELKDHLVLIGYGTVGHLTVDTILPLKKPFIVIDYDPRKMEILDELNFPYIYGDASNRHILEKASVEEADMVVITVPGDREVRTISEIVRELNPDCTIVARVHSEEVKSDIENKVDHIIYPEVLGGKAVVEVVDEECSREG